MARPDKRGYKLKRPGRSTAPAAIVSVVVEKLHDRELTDSPGAATATVGRVVVAARRKVRGVWCREERHSWDDPRDFWSWLYRWSQRGRKCYVFSPRASDTLVLLGFPVHVQTAGAVWVRHSKGETQPRDDAPLGERYGFFRLVLKGTPDIVDYTHMGRSFCWLSCSNYFSCDISELPVVPETEPAKQPHRAGKPHGQPRDRWETECDAWLAVFVRLADWWLRLDAGKWAPTAGAMAERFLRSRMTDPVPCTHKHPDALRLERLAAHRGRVSSWFFGAVTAPDAAQVELDAVPPGPFPTIQSDAVMIDVASMYPWLLTQVRLPVSLWKHKDTITPSQLLDLTGMFVATAAVRLDTDAAEYPHRSGESVTYPVGQFTAYLSGRELERALRDGVVTKVYEANLYVPGMPFKAAAEELLRMRTDAKASGDKGWELFVKLLSNSMTGKLNQRKSRWVERPGKVPLKTWGEWPEVHAQTGVRRYFRAVFGLVWERVTDEPATGTLAACYAHLTAACSDHMRTVREALPPRSVFSQDTDGLWCLPACEATLAAKGFQFGKEPGRLRVDRRSSHSRWWGPKHYFAAGEWRLSGLHAPVKASDGLIFLDTVTLNKLRSSPTGATVTVVDARRAITLNVIPAGGTVGPDGWLVPARLPAGRTAAPTPDDVEEGDRDCEKQDGDRLFDD